LVALTPRLGWRRRTLALAGGVAALFAANVVLNALALYIDDAGLGRYPAGLSLVSDVLPFVLWAFVARDWLRGFARSEAGGEPQAVAGRAQRGAAERSRPQGAEGRAQRGAAERSRTNE
jgi:hypothetical protein